MGMEPVHRAVMQQGWYDLCSLHYRYDPDVVSRVLPPGLEVDIHDGSAWVGLIPFSMRRIGLPHLPAVPYFGSFPEVNVRTYVVRDGRPGVWFCSLDISRLVPALVARGTYLLPYCWGRARHDVAHGRAVTMVQRRWPKGDASTSIEVEIGERIDEPSPLDEFVTARWGLYSRGFRNKLRYAPIEHVPWPLHRATATHVDDSLITAAGLPAPSTEPYTLYSPGVHVRIGAPHRAG
jgi:uncharacterized protein YqjF (DUF2071 family)